MSKKFACKACGWEGTIGELEPHEDRLLCPACKWALARLDYRAVEEVSEG